MRHSCASSEAVTPCPNEITAALMPINALYGDLLGTVQMCLLVLYMQPFR